MTYHNVVFFGPRRGLSRLTRQMIVSAALDLLEKKSLHAVRFWRLAELLKVPESELRCHFPSRSQLLHAMADAIIAEAILPAPATASGVERLRECAVHAYRAMRMRRNGATLFSQARNAATICYRPGLLGLLADGHTTSVAQRFVDIIDAFTIGWAVRHLAADLYDQNCLDKFEDDLTVILTGMSAPCNQKRDQIVGAMTNTV